MKGYLNVREAAERLGVSRQMVHSLIARGKLRGEKVSARAWLVSEADVEARLSEPRDVGGRPRKED